MKSARFFEWGENDKIHESAVEFVSHAGMWAIQIPIIYIWRKPIASLALSFLTASSMMYHKQMCTRQPYWVVNMWLRLDYFAIIASVLVSFVPYSTVPDREVWTETWQGQLLIALTCLMGVLGIFVVSGYIKSNRIFHALWHLYICGPILLYSYLKKDIRQVYSEDTFGLLETTAIAAYFSLVLSQIAPILSLTQTHAPHGHSEEEIPKHSNLFAAVGLTF